MPQIVSLIQRSEECRQFIKVFFLSNNLHSTYKNFLEKNERSLRINFIVCERFDYLF